MDDEFQCYKNELFSSNRDQEFGIKFDREFLDKLKVENEERRTRPKEDLLAIKT